VRGIGSVWKMELSDVEAIANAVVLKISKGNGVLPEVGPDLSISDIKKILGVGNSAAYSSRYYGEYIHNGRRMVRREEFMYRRSMGLDVCIGIKK